ncbi:MAG: F0F1 ATP synthase subunit B family protein, partial [Gammaproteobacteria bacterium]
IAKLSLAKAVELNPRHLQAKLLLAEIYFSGRDFDQAQKESERLLEAAKAQIEQETLQARENLRKEVSALALRAAEQILKEEIDKAKHQELLNKTAEQLG